MARGTKGTHAHSESPSAVNDAKAASSAKEVSSSKKRKAEPTVPTSNEATTHSKIEVPEDISNASQPPLPDEPTPPPLPDEEPPAQEPEDDGWQPVWDDAHQAFYFYNRFTQATQWENPRVPVEQALPTNHDRIAGSAPSTSHAAPEPDTTELHPAVAGGYNPAVHGSYDPNAPYAKYANPTDPAADTATAEDAANADAENYAGAAHFNRFTGRFQSAALQPSNFNDESKAKRQMNAFFDVDAAANSHDGRSLKAERAGKKLTKSEVKQFRERRRERKEEKRRAWLRD